MNDRLTIQNTLRAVKFAAVWIFLATTGAVAAADISELHWMSGCWSYDGEEPGSGEYWMPAAGDSMIAASRTVRDGLTVAFEYLRITQAADDTLELIASPSGQEAAHFNMIDMSATRVVFENPKHDFPQRIIYELRDSTHLLGRIEGTSGEEEVAVDFPMTRADCNELGE